ncbi:MAG: hypothetical protein AAF485_27890 [Chloroflexota bacterium]
MIKKEILLLNLLGFAFDWSKLVANETQQLAPTRFFSRLYPTYF